ncbi:MAG: DUF1294 domain-containing protein [Lachnospiraceae bacterium]|nr:DUF1294 domain-containing protein [Lachnospiraceae bacterium]
MQYVWIYLAVINVVAFIVYGIDKHRAKAGAWRISEMTLWVLAAIGGSVGALLGMEVFRHKTKKRSFQIVIAAIVFVQVLLVLGWVYYKSR